MHVLVANTLFSILCVFYALFRFLWKAWYFSLNLKKWPKPAQTRKSSLFAKNKHFCMFRVSEWKVKAFPSTFKVFLRNSTKCAKCIESWKSAKSRFGRSNLTKSRKTSKPFPPGGGGGGGGGLDLEEILDLGIFLDLDVFLDLGKFERRNQDFSILEFFNQFCTFYHISQNF